MSREQVKKTADDIGYEHHDIEVPERGIIASEKNIPSELSVDVYYFRNVMLSSVVKIEYDSAGQVFRILRDQ